MDSVQKTTPSNIMKILDVFEYKGIKVVIRQWYNCFEYLLVHHGQLFCDYVEYGTTNSQTNDTDLKGIRDHLRSAAIDTIDWHEKQRSILNQLKTFYEKRIKPRAAK